MESRTLIRAGIALLLLGLSDVDLVAQVPSVEAAVRVVQDNPVDVVTLDVDLPDARAGTQAIRVLRNASPSTRILILSNDREPAVVRAALNAGALGYLLKSASPEELAKAIHATYRSSPIFSAEITETLTQEAALPARGGKRLTLRERQVLDLMAGGLNNYLIARELGICSSTVEFHVSNILAKLHVRNRTEAATFAVRHHLTAPKQA